MEVFISMSSTVAESKGIDIANNHLALVIDRDTGKKMVNVIDNETGRVVRQIPASEVLDLEKKREPMT